MALRFVVGVALFAVCYSSPLEDVRGKRDYTVAQGYSSQYGKNTAHAVINGNNAEAQASNDDDNLVRNGLAGPGQVYVKTYNGPSQPTHYDYAPPNYYPVPAPATVVAYQKYADVPAQIVYEAPAPAAAQSSATTNGAYGSVNANANTGLGSAVSNAAAEGSGLSTVSSNAQTNGLGLVEPAVIAAKNQGYYSAYTPYSPVNAASANANTNGHLSSANAAAKTGAVPTRKSISWRFGTAYDHPAAYGAAKAAATNFGYNSAAANSATSGSSLRSTANSAGHGSAQSSADNTAVKSAANSNGGYANADAIANNGNYAALRSDNLYAGYNGITSSASTQNGGAAASQAQIDAAGHEIVHSAAKSSQAGSAQSIASSNGGAHGLRSTGAWGGRIVSNAYSKGDGSALSSANSQGLSTGYRVVNTHANSGLYGSAGSNAYTL